MRAWLCAFSLSLAALIACSSTEEPAASEAPTEKPVVPSQNPGEDPELKKKEKDPSTTLTLGLAAEEMMGSLIQKARIVAKIDGVIAADKSLLRENGKAIFPQELVLAATTNAPNAKVEIEIKGWSYAGEVDDDTQNPPMYLRTLKTSFVQGKAKLAYVLAEVRCNRSAMAGGYFPMGPSCEAGSTCIGGKCRSEDATPLLVDYYADWRSKPPSRCGTGAEMTIEPGTGADAFTTLADGATVTLEEGPQCGVHFWLAVRMKNLSQNATTTTLSAKQPGTNIVVPPTAYPYAYAEGDAVCELPGLRFQVDLSASKKDFLGKPLDVTIEATDNLGHTVSVVRRVNIAATTAGSYPHCNN